MWGAAEAELIRSPTRDPLEWFGGGLVSASDPTFRAAVERGRRLTLWDGAAVALGEVEPPQPVA